MTEIKAAAYESIMIVSCTLGEEGIQSIVEKFKTMIEANATLESVDEWGERKLAYPIEKQTEGYYVLFNFISEPEFLAELDRVYNITEGVLRSLTVKKEA